MMNQLKKLGLYFLLPKKHFRTLRPVCIGHLFQENNKQQYYSPLVFLQLLILMHWMENFSHNAIKVKTRDKQIQDLLLEKDLLIENLSNKNALVETGALSAGLAHEFNQLLARIELNSGEVLDKINRPNVNLEELKFSMGNILKANHSAANLIISLKKLFQSGKDRKSVV